MRIISGKYKGKKIVAPKRIDARPTTDVAKEGLFNILCNRVDFENLVVLDLFAGTGNISFEFASRGASPILSVDIQGVSCEFIYSVSNSLNLGIKVRRFDVFKFLPKCVETFDIIFADPPYLLEGIEKLVGLVFENNLLNPDGLFILEHSREYDFANNPYFQEKRKYGKVNFSFFKQH